MNRRHLRRRFDRRAAEFAANDFAHRHAAAELLARLEPIRLAATNVLDLGAGGGRVAAALRQRYPRARIIELDHSLGMLKPGTRRLLNRRPRGICADATALPFRAGVFDLIVSNFCLPWLATPDAAIAEAARTLRAGGVLLFSTLGPDSFAELVPIKTELGLPPSEFLDMHDIGDALVRGGLTEPVLDVERTALEYRSAAEFLHELRATGSTAALPARFGASTRKQFEAALDGLAAGEVLRVTLEIVYGHAFATTIDANRGLSAPVTINPAQIGRRRR